MTHPDRGHTPLPWSAAAKYSSISGVPIVNRQGQRVANTALPHMPVEWDDLKRQAELDAALIVEAVNQHAALKARVAELSTELAVLIEYGERTIGPESPGHHPTLPSAVFRARAVLADKGAGK